MTALAWGSSTNLVISTFGVPPYSARGLKQTLEPMFQNVATTINGSSIDLTPPILRLYKSTITGSDIDPPAADMLWPGALLTVDCIAELCYKTSGGSPSRTVVSGSSRVEGDFTFYRPRLSMVLIEGPSWDFDEWGASNQWSMTLREVAA